MRFGEKLKKLRGDKQLTQPELAEALGIEQSYLSKLENGKSLPSNDVLNRILTVFESDIGGFVKDLNQGSQNQLRQIPDVAEHFRQEKQQLIGNRKRWLLLSALSLAFGIALVYAGSVNLFFASVVYQYKSHGVVLAGEPKEIFRRPMMAISEVADHKVIAEFRDSINARINEDFLTITDFRGSVFNVAVAGGSRTYYLDGEKEIDPWQSKLVVFLGVILTILGLLGMFLERKLAGYQ